MFSYLKGTLAEKDINSFVIDVGGVGFFCTASAVTLNSIGNIGDQIKIYTYMAVREDAMELFGFADKAEHRCFKQLISVSGVGPKAAVAILSELTVQQFTTALVSGDYKTITRAQGVGPKLAQRIILELKGKLSEEQITAGVASLSAFAPNGNEHDALEALVSLGYAPTEAKDIISQMNTKDMSAEDIIRMALKFLM